MFARDINKKCANPFIANDDNPNRVMLRLICFGLMDNLRAHTTWHHRMLRPVFISKQQALINRCIAGTFKIESGLLSQPICPISF